MSLTFLDEVNGQSEESLAVTVLQYLVTRSVELRTVLLDEISDVFLDRPVLDRAEGFFISREVSTRSTADERGFLDLMIESPTAVIGIELKIWAEMQDGQPRKYLEDVQSRAKQLTAARIGTIVEQKAVPHSEVRTVAVNLKDVAL